jgi:plastocyanin
VYASTFRKAIWMRKFALTLLVGVALFMAACAGGSTANTAPTNTVVPPPATATTAPTVVPATATTAPAAGAATIGMGSRSFIGGTVTIKVGQSVTFSDPATTGGIHQLVTGSNGTFAAEAGAPSAFASSTGIAFSPGTTMAIAFPTAGTYMITCKIHPSMEATITVSA